MDNFTTVVLKDVNCKPVSIITIHTKFTIVWSNCTGTGYFKAKTELVRWLQIIGDFYNMFWSYFGKGYSK